jgi:hypothetical protein
VHVEGAGLRRDAVVGVTTSGAFARRTVELRGDFCSVPSRPPSDDRRDQ